MTQANTARRDGDAFQARQFWLRAARLLDDRSPILRVGFESGPKSYDDIWVQYDPSHGPSDQYGRPLLREHLQCKWHVSPDSYGYRNLVDPDFVNANARSLLQRAHRAQLDYAPAGEGARFKLLTNWRLDRADPLREVIGNRSGALRVDRLYGTQTDNSKVGAIRKSWREHLGIDQDALKVLVDTLAFGEATDSLDDIREQLDILFGFVGLRRVPLNQSAFEYDDLVYQWMAQGRLEFDRVSFRQACEREGLLVVARARPPVFGVKSFEHALDRLEDRCVRVLDFVPDFDERYLRTETDWADKLYPSLKTFLLEAAKHSERPRLALDTHVTLAFAAGSVLNHKLGRVVELEQRSPVRQVWAEDDFPRDSAWPVLECNVIEIAEGRHELAVAASTTHDITTDVRAYIDRELPQVGRLLLLRPTGGPGRTTIACGRHASDLAASLAALVKKHRVSAVDSMMHLFVAGPNAFAFFVGQQQVTMGRTCLYEFDFDRGKDGSYSPSLTLPIATQ